MALPEPNADVVTRVSTLAAASARPVLSPAEVVASIKAHPVVDRDGITADDPAWTQTWDLNATLAELWGVKAGRVAGDFNFSADDARYDKGAVLANCLEMVALYSSRLSGAVSTVSSKLDDLGNLVVNG